MRLPELFCGFARSAGEAPVAYPVACLPQAWSVGLGLHAAAVLPRARRRRLGERNPGRPARGCRSASTTSPIRHLARRPGAVDVHFQRVGDRVACYLDRPHEGLVPLIVQIVKFAEPTRCMRNSYPTERPRRHVLRESSFRIRNDIAISRRLCSGLIVGRQLLLVCHCASALTLTRLIQRRIRGAIGQRDNRGEAAAPLREFDKNG